MPAKVTKTDVVAEYLKKFPQLTPKEIADRIVAERKVKVTNDYVSKVKGKLKRPKKKAPAAAKPKPAAAKPKSRPATAPAAKAPSRQVSQHISNIKDAVLTLGKDEARRILELF